MKFFDGLIGIVLSLASSLDVESKEQSNQYYARNKDREQKVEYYNGQNKKPLETYEVPRPKIIRASKYEMGDGLLGVAFPERNLAVILDSLNGEDFEKVKRHEKHHLDRPWDSEYATRESTGTLNWNPNPYTSII